MMLGEPHRANTTVRLTPWPQLNNDTTADSIFSPHSLNGNASGSPPDYSNMNHLQEAFAALNRYLPSNNLDLESDGDISGLDPDSPLDAYSCDHFRMYEFKVRKCTRGRSHDWTECPYAHPGEKAQRRDPRKHHYSGTACPDFRKGSCNKGDICEFAHGVFECWLHPARYRTQPCKDGLGCKRRVCFFAHKPGQLRILPQQSPRSADSPCAKTVPFLSSPESISPPTSPRTESPISPHFSPSLGSNSINESLGSNSINESLGSNSINEMVASLRNLQLGKVKSLPSSWNLQMGNSSGYGSPRGSILRPGFYSPPSTPPRVCTRPGIGYLDFFDNCCEEEPVMERVESGRVLRVKMFEKLSKENSLDGVDPDPLNGAPDVGWVSDLVNEGK